MPAVARKFDIRCNTCVEQYHIGRIDSQSAGGLDARDLVGCASDEGKDICSDRKPNAKSLQLVFDDLGHVRIHAGQDMRLHVHIDERSLPSACRDSAISRPTYPAPMIATRLALGARR